MGLGLEAGTIFAGDYRVVRPLSAGGMGAVWVVEQISTSKERALKLMHPQLVADPTLRKRFEQEAQVGARIRSEHIVEVQAAGVDAASGTPYLVMELLRGEDLATRVERRGPMPLAEVLVVFEQLCHAVGAAHRADVVHRDLKPENIFLAESMRAGASLVVKVLDFGIAKVAAEADARSKSTSAMGSPMWMSPEQTERGPVMPTADVWALGLIAFFALTGKPYWRAANSEGTVIAQLMREILFEPMPPPSVRAAEYGRADLLPPWFDKWFLSCTTRDPRARMSDANQVFAELSLAASSQSFTPAPMPLVAPVQLAPAPTVNMTPPPYATATPVAPPAPTGGRAAPIALVVGGLAFVALAVAGGGWLAWSRLHHENATATSPPAHATETTAPPVESPAPSASSAIDPAAKYYVYVPTIANTSKLSDDEARKTIFDAFGSKMGPDVHFVHALETRDAGSANAAARGLKAFELRPTVTATTTPSGRKIELQVTVFTARGDLLGEVKPTATGELDDGALLRATAERAAQQVVTVFTSVGTAASTSASATSVAATNAPAQPHSVVREGSMDVNGRLPPEVIRRIVRQHFGAFKLCYDNGLRSNSSLAGKVVVKFVIDHSGDVSTTQNGASTLSDADVVSCVMRPFRNMSFPQPEGGIVTVSYTLTFSMGT